MNKIFNHITQTDKRRLLIYLFSYAIYRLVNNSFSYSVLTLLNEHSFRDRWTAFTVPCGVIPDVFVILFQLFKVLLFIALIRLTKQKTNGLLSEILIAYFIYDLIYILAFLWMFLPLPVDQSQLWVLLSTGPSWSLISTGQIFLNHYFLYLDVIFATLWTLTLFIFLKLQNRLSLKFLINRLTIIPISVFSFFWVFYYLGKLVMWLR